MADSGWTLDTLKQHFDDLRAADKRALDAAFAAAAEKSATHNDLITAMKDQQSTYVTKGMIYTVIIAMVAIISLAATLLGKIG